MIRQTGGLARSATSTRSSSRARARFSASGSGLMPSCSPSEEMTRTSRARIFSLIRGSCGVAIADHSSCRRNSSGASDGTVENTSARIQPLMPAPVFGDGHGLHGPGASAESGYFRIGRVGTSPLAVRRSRTIAAPHPASSVARWARPGARDPFGPIVEA